VDLMVKHQEGASLNTGFPETEVTKNRHCRQPIVHSKDRG
jgi:hypothetical protein